MKSKEPEHLLILEEVENLDDNDDDESISQVKQFIMDGLMSRTISLEDSEERIQELLMNTDIVLLDYIDLSSIIGKVKDDYHVLSILI